MDYLHKPCMKKLILLIYNFFRELLQPKPGPREYYLSQGLSSQPIYRTAAEKSEPEEKKSVPPQETEIKPPIADAGYPTLSNMFSQGKGGFPSLTAPRSLFEPLPPIEPLPPLPPLSPLPPLEPLAPLVPLEPLPPLKIKRTDDYSPCKNLSTKQVIQAKRVSREDALRLSHLPLTNDISQVGDDTIKVPTRSGQTLFITPDPVMTDETYIAEREKFTTFIETIIEQSKEDNK